MPKSYDKEPRPEGYKCRAKCSDGYHFWYLCSDGKYYWYGGVVMGHISSECPYQDKSCLEYCSSLTAEERPCMKVKYGKYWRGKGSKYWPR